MPPKAFRRQRNPGASSAASSASSQAAIPRNPALHSAAFDAELERTRAMLAPLLATASSQQDFEGGIDAFGCSSPNIAAALKAMGWLSFKPTAPPISRIATPSPPPPVVVSPSPALSYASLDSAILKRPRSPGSSSSGSSRAESIIDVDMLSSESESRCPTPTPLPRVSGLPAPLTSASTGLPVATTTRSPLDMSRAVTPFPEAPDARPPMPPTRADTPVSHVAPQPPAAPKRSLNWVALINALELAVSAISECPPDLTSRFANLGVIKFSSPAVDKPKVPAHPKKKVRITPASPPASAPAPSAPAIPPTAAMSAPAPKKAVAAPPALSSRPDPKAAPPVSIAKTARKRRQGKHTAHGASRRGIILTPPAGSTISAGSFTPEVINNLNHLLEKDLKSEVVLTHAVAGHGIFIAATRVPTSPEVAFVLKHVRRLFPSPAGSAINSAAATSTSFLKVIDVPITKPDPMSKDWVTPTRAAFMAALATSPVGSALTDVIKHTPRIMKVSAHSDSCVAWIDISDTVSGANARRFVSQFISVGGVNCRVIGAKPHSGSVFCTRCNRWGHHSSQCRRLGVRCPLCGGPHSEANHHSMVDASRVDQRSCVNCVATKRAKHSHSATDRACPFWKNRFDRAWLKRQFQAPANITQA